MEDAYQFLPKSPGFTAAAGGGIDPIRLWYDVPYSGGNIGIRVTDSTTTSVCGAVNSDCESTGTIYYAVE